VRHYERVVRDFVILEVKKAASVGTRQSVSGKSLLRDLGLNSIGLIAVLLALERRFAISFSEFELRPSAYRRLEDIVIAGTSKLAASTPRSLRRG
jgi:acyl carrier protein